MPSQSSSAGETNDPGRSQRDDLRGNTLQIGKAGASQKRKTQYAKDNTYGRAETGSQFHVLLIHHEILFSVIFPGSILHAS